MKKFITAAVIATFAISSPASAAVTFDPASGTGFVGKGDVQLALGLNNSQLQSAVLSFTYESVEVSETSWVCTNVGNKNLQTQERERTTTSTKQGVVSAVARVKNQITGFNLSGYTSSSSSSTADGPKLNSCPTGWELTTEAGDAEVLSSEGGLFVNGTAIG
jgi:hypothetical protein